MLQSKKIDSNSVLSFSVVEVTPVMHILRFSWSCMQLRRGHWSAIAVYCSAFNRLQGTGGGTEDGLEQFLEASQIL